MLEQAPHHHSRRPLEHLETVDTFADERFDAGIANEGKRVPRFLVSDERDQSRAADAVIRPRELVDFGIARDRVAVTELCYALLGVISDEPRVRFEVGLELCDLVRRWIVVAQATEPVIDPREGG